MFLKIKSIIYAFRANTEQIKLFKISLHFQVVATDSEAVVTVASAVAVASDDSGDRGG